MDNSRKKMTLVRSELNDMSLTKSGINKYSGYKYFELADFLPQANKLLSKHGLFSRFYIDEREPMTDGNSILMDEHGIVYKQRMAHLEFVNVEDDIDSFEYSIDMVAAPVKGATPIQEYGSMITYLRRYLWMMALELSENDVQDSQPSEDKVEEKPKPKKKKQEEVYMATPAQIKIFNEKYSERVPDMLQYYGVETLEALTMEQASEALALMAKEKKNA